MEKISKDWRDTDQYKIYQKIAEFQRPVYYVAQSYADLISYVESVFKNTKKIKWSLSDDYPNEGAEIDRLLFNLLSAFKLLIDTTRALNKFLNKHEIEIPNYQDKIDSTFKDNVIIDIVSFIRNEYTHHRPILLVEEITYSDDKETRRIIFERDSISNLEFKSKTKEYLTAKENKIDVLDLVTTYYNIIKPFYYWLNKEIHAVQAPLINYINEIKKDY